MLHSWLSELSGDSTSVPDDKVIRRVKFCIETCCHTYGRKVLCSNWTQTLALEPLFRTIIVYLVDVVLSSAYLFMHMFLLLAHLHAPEHVSLLFLQVQLCVLHPCWHPQDTISMQDSGIGEIDMSFGDNLPSSSFQPMHVCR